MSIIPNPNERIKRRMRQIINNVEQQIPDGWGVVVLTFPFSQNNGELIYGSNANREDVVNCMKEFIEKTENNYGNDTGKY